MFRGECCIDRRTLQVVVQDLFRMRLRTVLDEDFLTRNHQANQDSDAQFHGEDVKKKVAQVVGSHAIVHPRTVTGRVSMGVKS